MTKCCCKNKEKKIEEVEKVVKVVKVVKKAKVTKTSKAKKESQLQYRDTVKKEDIESVRSIIQSSNFFNQEEIDIAAELVQDRFEKAEKSTYEFLFAEQDQKNIGYSCFGRIPGTKASYDLYWIAVENQDRGKGIGKDLLARTEQVIQKAGGYKIYVETSSQEKYAPTRHFYLKSGYILEACLKDFYGPNDDKHIYTKQVGK